MAQKNFLYIHIPFCKSKCLFCSFVIAVGKEHRTDAYLDALAKEAGLYRGAALETVYIGGGTPTFLSTDQLKRLFGIIKENFTLADDAEITIEANPENIEFEKATVLKSLGVNRISLGVQSLNEKYLQFLGRSHNVNDVHAAFEILRNTKFDNINLDLMFSFPGQSLDELTDDVEKITSFNSEHLSLYTLMIEEKSRFFAQNIKLESGELRGRQYAHVVRLLEKKKFRQYEVSNFAKPQRESRHNSIYWQGGNYIGLGVGAHSHSYGKRFWNVSSLMTYLSRLEKGESPVEDFERLTIEQQFVETLLFGLRMIKGVDVYELEKRFGWMLPEDKKGRLREFVKSGFLSDDGRRIKTTLKGRLILDELCTRLV